MAIQTEFIDFIVNISAIRKKYPGGWEACLEDHAHLLGGRVWYDDHLFRDGAMSPDGIASLVEHWTRLGLTGRAQVGGEDCWVDFCIYESMFGGLTLPCTWLLQHGASTVAHIDDSGTAITGREPAMFNSK